MGNGTTCLPPSPPQNGTAPYGGPTSGCSSPPANGTHPSVDPSKMTKHGGCPTPTVPAVVPTNVSLHC